jgi:hypothetical protein
MTTASNALILVIIAAQIVSLISICLTYYWETRATQQRLDGSA